MTALRGTRRDARSHTMGPGADQQLVAQTVGLPASRSACARAP